MRGYALIILSLWLLSTTILHAQNLDGVPGLFRTPTADFGHDGQVVAGAGFWDKEHQAYTHGKYNSANVHLLINWLPRVQLGVKITRVLGLPDSLYNNGDGSGHVADRCPMARFLLLTEGDILPAAVVGFNDFYNAYGGTGASHFYSLYTVVGKHLPLAGGKLGLHAGYSIQAKSASQYNLNDGFGGVDWEYGAFTLIGEYDGKYANAGCRVKLFDRWHMLAGLTGMSGFYASTGVSFDLLDNKVSHE